MTGVGEPSPPFVLDSDCIIKLGRMGYLRYLIADSGAFIIPSRVERELRRYRRPKSIVLAWLNRNQSAVRGLSLPQEHACYYRLLISDNLGEGESAGIAIASTRGHPFASDDRLARAAAVALGVQVLNPIELAQLIVPSFKFPDD